MMSRQFGMQWKIGFINRFTKSELPEDVRRKSTKKLFLENNLRFLAKSPSSQILKPNDSIFIPISKII